MLNQPDYVQQMKSLAFKHETETIHAQFESGNHSIRRTNRFCAGLSTDLVIEQTMMLPIKPAARLFASCDLGDSGQSSVEGNRLGLGVS